MDHFDTKTMEVPFKKLRDNAQSPTRGSEEAAGFDLSACLDKAYDYAVIFPHETRKIGTGIAVEVPKGCFGAVFARSGLATKNGLRPANCVGIIDSDYRGEIFIPIHNDGNEQKFVANKERIAQLIILPYIPVTFKETDDLNETERGEGGFGSTGK